MGIPVTKTKVILPQRRDDLMPRSRLLELLYNLLDHKLILVTANAGYGKTSLLVDFAHRAELPVCWYALDPLDTDTERFIAHLIASIQERFPSFGVQSKAALNPASQSSPDLSRIASTIVNEAYDHIREHFIIVLDDYHLVNENKDIDRFVNLLTQYAGENCHFILSSRMLIALEDLPLMISRSQVGGLGHEDLAFTADEIKSLILRNYRVVLPDAEAEALLHATEGWITGLLLSAQTMWTGMSDRLRLARASGIDLYDYLAQQVLDQQPEEIRAFLLRSSLLEEFDAALCRSVFGEQEDWSTLVDQLLQRNLFVLPVGRERKWIRYHHLFRDFLQARLARDHPEERERILRRLVEVYSVAGEWEKAYDICQRLEDESLTLALIEDAGTLLLKNGRLSLLKEWIDQLPDKVQTQRPVILSLKGTVYSVQGDFNEGMPLLDRADEVLRTTNDLTSLAANLVRRADIWRLKGEYQSSIKDAGEALSLTKDSPPLRSWYAGALRSIGVSYFEIGKLDDAIGHLSESLEVYQSLKDWQLVAMVRMELGLANMNAGNFKRATDYYEASLTYWRQKNDPIRESTILYNLGVLHYLTGKHERAASFFEEGLSLAKQSAYLRMEAYILSGIGDLYADLGAFEPALEAYQKTREVARQVENRLLSLYADLAEANQHRLRGDFEKTRSLLTSAQKYIGANGSSYETGLYWLERGKLELSTGNLPESIKGLKQASHIFDEDGQLVEAARAYLYLAMANHASGQNREALETLGKAFQISEKVEDLHGVISAGREAKDLLEFARTVPRTKHQATKQLNQIAKFERDIPSIRRRLRPQVSTIPFAPPKLYIRALGETQVELDGDPVQVPEWQYQKKVREFFYYVLAHPEGLSKERIGATLFPESSPHQLKIQFKNLIYRLRCALGQDAVTFRHERYFFNTKLDYRYDVEIFQRKIEAAKSAESPDVRLSAYLEAIELYKGPFLLDLDSSWAWPERQRLAKMYISAIAGGAQIYLEAKEYDKTLSYSDIILREDHCFEEAYRLKMQAHAALGNRAEVIRQYRLCERVLAEELDTKPSPQTEALYFKLTQ